MVVRGQGGEEGVGGLVGGREKKEEVRERRKGKALDSDCLGGKEERAGVWS